MTNRYDIFALLLMASACAMSATSLAQLSNHEPTIDTRVIDRKSAYKEESEWGLFVKYFEGDTLGTENVLSGTAEIKAGEEIHPPHAHKEEEYLMILEGAGTWTINGEIFEAKEGDMLYASPWDVHGVKNTGDTALKFVFWKWNSKGIDTPTAPVD